MTCRRYVRVAAFATLSPPATHHRSADRVYSCHLTCRRNAFLHPFNGGRGGRRPAVEKPPGWIAPPDGELGS